MFLLLLPLSCLAVPPLPFFAKPVASSQSALQSALVGAAFRWVASDLTANAAISGNWTDRIQGVAWTQGASANQPTNSSQGVWLDSTHFLTNNGGFFVGSNCTFGAVWKVIDPGNYANQLQDGFLYSALASFACGCGNEVYIGFAGTSSGVAPLCFFCGAPSAYLAASPNPFPVTNVVSDMVISQALTNTGGGGNLWCWTNNILSALQANGTGTFNAGSGNNGYWGYSNTNQPRTLGRNAWRGSGAKMFLQELWAWTNNLGSTGALISDSVRTNWHTAMTNLYGFSP